MATVFPELTSMENTKLISSGHDGHEKCDYEHLRRTYIVL